MSDRTTTISGDVVEGARRGDRDALRMLVESAYPSVRRWALVHMGDPADADDLAQDVMVKLIRKVDTFHGASDPMSWLYALTRNAAMDRHRKRARTLRIERDPEIVRGLAPSEQPGPVARLERAELTDTLLSYFTDLPDRQREVFDLVELQGLSAGEVACLMGIEPVSVRAHLFKARRTMRTRFLAERPELAGDRP